MFEIKITGNTAEEIRKDLNELAIVFGTKEEDETEPSIDAAADQEPKSEPKQPEPESEPAEEEKSTKDTETAKEDKPTEAAKEEPKLTLEEVRAKAAALQRAGSRELVKAVITGAGAKRLTEVDPEKYDWMMKCFESGEVIK